MNKNQYEKLVKWRKKILSPIQGHEWAGEMVLNPAIIKDPESRKIHMLFRATGPWEKAQIDGKPLPYPIFFGYGWSEDGENFEFDLETPALAPKLEYEKDKIYIDDIYGNKCPDFSNGCIEDPRLFFVEGECYLNAACRMFPPGPYWEHDDPVQCMPEWALTDENEFGTRDNPTVNVLYKVDLAALEKREYEKAFSYVCHLTDPEKGEDRDLFFFEDRMEIDGKKCYVMIHRPHHPDRYGLSDTRPSIVMSAAENLMDFAKDKNVKRTLLLTPDLPWQREKVGASTPPIKLSNGEWLLNYHGKEDVKKGYGQSFMILENTENGFPKIKHICNDKMIVNTEDFESPSKFTTPCVFFTGLIEHDSDLLCAYGAADEHVGLMKIDYPLLMRILRNDV
ncbi:MAG: hypothetical protein IKV88_08455 [Clostridia bacterium]|nr:hypothetical protein [Clostridia bacterium]